MKKRWGVGGGGGRMGLMEKKGEIPVQNNSQ